MKNNKKSGYAIMFTVVLVSIISLIGIGLSNITYKQLLLSSGAKDSQIAFYMSDMATECALYADNGPNRIDQTSNPLVSFDCGIDADGNSYTLNVNFVDDGEGSYTMSPIGLENSLKPCFRTTTNKVSKTEEVDGEDIFYTQTIIRASGYNICDQSNPRTVERTIEVTY